MINKITAFLIRVAIFACISGMASSVAYGLTKDFSIGSVAFGLVIIPGLFYSINKFNRHFNFHFLNASDKIVSDFFNKRKKRSLEEEMKNLKQLYDSNILTTEEYTEKLTEVKKEYMPR